MCSSANHWTLPANYLSREIQLSPGQPVLGSSWSDQELSPTLLFTWFEFSLPRLSTCFVQDRIAILYQLSALTARTDLEEIATLNNCSFHTYSGRLHPVLNEIKPSAPMPPWEGPHEPLSHTTTLTPAHTPVHAPAPSNLTDLPQHGAERHTGCSQTMHFLAWSNLKVSGSTLLTQNKLLLSRNPSNCIEWHPLAIIWYILRKRKKEREREINNHNYVLLSGKVKKLTWPEENFISSLPPWPLFCL